MSFGTILASQYLALQNDGRLLVPPDLTGAEHLRGHLRGPSRTFFAPIRLWFDFKEAHLSDSCRVSTGSFCQYRLLNSKLYKTIDSFHPCRVLCFYFLMNFCEPQNNESKWNFVGHHMQPRLHVQSYAAEGSIRSRLTKNRQKQKHFSILAR